MNTIRTAKMACPYCKAVNDAATCLTEDPAPPRDGDVTVCFKCASIMLFSVAGRRLTVRKPNDAELNELRHNPEIAAFRVHLLRTARERGWELTQVKS